jgi:hypothetical protein
MHAFVIPNHQLIAIIRGETSVSDPFTPGEGMTFSFSLRWNLRPVCPRGDFFDVAGENDPKNGINPGQSFFLERQ